MTSSWTDMTDPFMDGDMSLGFRAAAHYRGRPDFLVPSSQSRDLTRKSVARHGVRLCAPPRRRLATAYDDIVTRSISPASAPTATKRTSSSGSIGAVCRDRRRLVRADFRLHRLAAR